MLAVHFFQSEPRANAAESKRDLKRSNSLKRKKDFRYTYRVGRSVQHRYFSCVTARNRTGDTRIGITVSKKQGNSVQRNRIKRRIREAVTPLIPDLRDGINIILVARHGILDAPFEDLCAAANSILKSAKAFRDMPEERG